MDGSAVIISSPWWGPAKAGDYLGGRSKRFVLREIKAGRLRAARIGNRGEILTRAEWLDDYVREHATPIAVMPTRRRA